MFIYTLYTVNGEAVGESALMRQALNAARNYAAAHHAPCIVECRSLDTDERRRVLLNADGTMVKLWAVA